MRSTSGMLICFPSSTDRRFTSSVWPTATLYCRPPLLITANIFSTSPFFNPAHTRGYVGGVGGGPSSQFRFFFLPIPVSILNGLSGKLKLFYVANVVQSPRGAGG